MKKLALNNSIEIPNQECNSSLYEIMGLNGPIINEQCSIALTKINPGGCVIRHKHIESEETYVFTKGSAVMIINEQEVPVIAGDTVIIHPEDIHEMKVSDDGSVEFYAITIPPFNEKDFIIV